jgi:hypothetical protein
MDNKIAELTAQIANSYAQQLDRHIEQFLKKNLIPFDGDIKKTNDKLEAKGMRLIREDDNPDSWGDRKSTYMLVKIIDSTSVTIKAPKLEQS